MSNPGPSAAGFNQADLLALQEALKDSYILQEQIGAGGMGTVFKAHDIKRDRSVAIKVFRADRAQNLGAIRFQQEIRTAARLTHPHIVSVFEDGGAAGMLYFVMPYVAGESLRARLTREGALSPDDAVHLAMQVANALTHAHAAGTVHRDIKPENILLADGHAWLADFGIARAAMDSGEGYKTTTGAIIGSPEYVSPEQLRGEAIDGRADIYSLGCVLFEMLVGRTPFGGRSLEATLLGHLTQAPATNQVKSTHLRRILAVALAKFPEERFASADEFEHALAGARVKLRWTRKIKRQLAVATAAFATGVGAISVIIAADIPLPEIGSKQPALDTMRYVVLPLPEDVPRKAELEIGIQNALAEWQGIELAHRETLTENLKASSSRRALARVARSSNVGRFVRASVSPLGDSLRISLLLMDGAKPTKTLASSPSITVAGIDSLHFGRLVESLVLRDMSFACRTQSPGTASLSAVHACDKAFSAINDGHLARADSFFVSALKNDPRYARAALWQAQIRSWVVPDPQDVTPQLQVALADTISLDTRERALLRGFVAMRNGDYDNACRSFSRLLSVDTLDYSAWLGVAECHSRDRMVLRDTRSPSKWSFRSNYNDALRAYRRAFELHPPLLGAYRDRSFYDLRTVLLTDVSRWLVGRSRDGALFAAFPAVTADTLAFVPYPMEFMEAGRNDARGQTSAVDGQRDLLRDLARRWTESHPGSSAAAEAAAVAAELVGDVRAITEIARARGLAREARERQRLAAAEVWMRLKFGLGGDEPQLRTARMLADSLVHLPVDDIVSAREFAALAILLGKPGLAASFARIAAPQMAADYAVPSSVAEAAAALEVFASLGAPVDSITKLEQELSLAIRNAISYEKQSTTAADLLTRSAMVAFPSHQLAALRSTASPGAYIDAERAFARGDITATRGALRRIAAVQRSSRPADLSADGLFVVAWLHNAIGESETAAAKLDAWLAAVRWFPPRRLNDNANVGSLMRAMLLRAQIATKAGNPSIAERWHRRVRILWSAAEPEVLQLIAAPPQRIK